MTTSVQAVDFTSFVFASNDEIKTTSLLVAEKFGKQHKNVLATIDKILTQVSDSFGKLNFKPTEYVQNNNLGIPVSYRMFEMTKDGFMILVMGFTGVPAMAIKENYINAFNFMVEKLRPKPNALRDLPVSKSLPNALSELLNARMTPQKKIMMLILGKNSNEDGQCQISITDLAPLCGIERSTTSKNLTDLVEAGFLTVTKTRYEHGGSQPNTYTIPERFRFVSGEVVEPTTQRDWINQPTQTELPAFKIPDGYALVDVNWLSETVKSASVPLQLDDLKFVVEGNGGLVLTKCEVDRMKGVLKA